ncbi:eukaryotic translation initiation factor 4B3 [Trifolium repens]|nr:eukaryotic translation initiation factor 4B3 [Trifolium repens]KAK2392590.1 eukaryotic translation initiation factor 4B3 [Trifolium repens]
MRIGEQKENRFGTSGGGGTDLANWNKKKDEFSVKSERSKNVVGRRPKLVLQPRSIPPSENQKVSSEKGQVQKVLPSDEGRSKRLVANLENIKSSEVYQKYKAKLENFKTMKKNKGYFSKQGKSLIEDQRKQKPSTTGSSIKMGGSAQIKHDQLGL